jgi:long-chain acyl-CoA synthetase
MAAAPLALPLAPQEQANLARSQDYLQCNSLPDVWTIAARKFVNTTACCDPHREPEVRLTYGQLHQQMQRFAAGLQFLGILPTGETYPKRVALFSDNQPRWLVADQGIMFAGAANVVRSSQADIQELLFILKNSEAVALIVEDLALLKKLRSGLDDFALEFIILLSDETPPADADIKIYNFSQILALAPNSELVPHGFDRNSLATLMYTSGTSGMPKGVMLTHGNLIHQVNSASCVLQLNEGDRVMSILPIWHTYERTFEYFIFSRGCTQFYTNIRYVKKDLKIHSPQYMVGVPRLWESIYEGIQKQFRDQPADKQKLVNRFLTASQTYINAKRTIQNLHLDNLNPSTVDKFIAVMKFPFFWAFHKVGDKLVYSKIRAGIGNIQYVVSGGGSIADHLEDFFEIIGVEVLGGYGLTETSPITHVRRPWRNLRGADGQPLMYTETKIVDLDSRREVGTGKKGVVLLRGPQIMKGYFNNPEATRKAIDPDGWFDSGDLGYVTEWGDLVLTGRAKDTIVLSNGENIEPLPIENACLRSPYVDQIMLVGQDQKSIGALIVPNLDALQQWSEQQGYSGEVDLNSKPIQDLFKSELLQRVKDRAGYRPDDRITAFRLLPEAFTVENGLLTQTLKVRRNVVTEQYAAIINEIFV